MSFAVTPRPPRPSKRTRIVFGWLDESLGRKDMDQLGRADPKRECSDCALRAGVAVAADEQRARQGQTQFRPDDMHNALSRLADIEQADPGRACPGTQAFQQTHAGFGRAGTAARWKSRDPE
jgi:hypothetical protein